MTHIKVNPNPAKERIQIIDALRGFALLGIMLIHGVEQFNFFYKTEHHFLFSANFDQIIIRSVFFMISQKAYSIFAILFGLSFFIQLTNQELNGNDFRKKFAWRLLILFFMGFIHRMFYNGDILTLYALLGFPLILTYRFNIKILWVLTILLVLQIPSLVQLIKTFISPDYVYEPLRPAVSSIRPGEVYAHGNLFEVLKFNLWKGSTRSFVWTYNTGRFYQLMALFIFGLIMGKSGLLYKIKEHTRNITKIIIVNFILAVSLFLFIQYIPNIGLTHQQQRLLKIILSSYYNIFFTLTLISVFLLIYNSMNGTIFKMLALYGRMSLTNYLTQTFFGTIFFYGYGFGMYRYMGYTWGLIYGFVFFALQITFCNWWLTKYKYGPVEWFWRATTHLHFRMQNKVSFS